MIDTHTHLYLSAYPEGGDKAVQRALDSGVSHMILPNVDMTTVEPMMALHSLFPETTSVAMGLHPTEVGEDWRQIVEKMAEMIDRGNFPAVGEVGIDLYWDTTRKKEQMEAFVEQLRIADSKNLPVIIHSRNALNETLDAIKIAGVSVPLVFHSFTGSPDDVKMIREVCDPLFGINGVVTFKNAKEVREALPEIGLKKILLETDSPYLAPVPNRGKRNESAYLAYIRNKIAETLSLTPEEVERTTDNNARELFGL